MLKDIINSFTSNPVKRTDDVRQAIQEIQKGRIKWRDIINKKIVIDGKEVVKEVEAAIINNEDHSNSDTQTYNNNNNEQNINENGNCQQEVTVQYSQNDQQVITGPTQDGNMEVDYGNESNVSGRSNLNLQRKQNQIQQKQKKEAEKQQKVNAKIGITTTTTTKTN